MEDKVGLKKTLYLKIKGTKQDKPKLFAKKIKKICNQKSQDLWL